MPNIYTLAPPGRFTVTPKPRRPGGIRGRLYAWLEERPERWIELEGEYVAFSEARSMIAHDPDFEALVDSVTPEPKERVFYGRVPDPVDRWIATWPKWERDLAESLLKGATE